VSFVPSANIARHLSEIAVRQPAGVALKIPQGRTSKGEIDYVVLSFSELETEVDAWCARLGAAGICRGDRTLVMVRQGLPLIASVFALFKIGAVPVIIDPGMGLKTFLASVARSRPRALVGIPLAQWVSRVARGAFSSVRVRVRASGSLTSRLARVSPSAARLEPVATCPVARTDLAAILFTSGSTGSPKGVCYEHGMFESQIRLIAETYSIQPGEIDLPMLPIFALFNPALGMTTIVPEIDPRRPAAVDPGKIVRAIQQENVTNSFGSPTLWRKIGEYCASRNIVMRSLRRVLCAGAPVPFALWESARTWMPTGRLHSPYGATEALPVSSISSDEIVLLHGVGACVGRPVPANQLKIIAITDDAIATLSDSREVVRGVVGEIIVTGPTVTKTYDSVPDATAAAKIINSATGEIWHRMGDCGYVDEAGRIWFCGRKAERVITTGETFFTEPCEQVFRTHPQVSRCALIGLGPNPRQRPAIVVELKSPKKVARSKIARELRVLAKSTPCTAPISLFYFHPKLPVDVRHNAKIHRLSLARWAEKARAYTTD
jgi:acyl-CoA synthetase (AMP-forming)/AMP-acid ligase II